LVTITEDEEGFAYCVTDETWPTEDNVLLEGFGFASAADVLSYLTNLGKHLNDELVVKT
jgi:hypothetical protein